jgi:peptide/nickel transport system substrate-binding protein
LRQTILYLTLFLLLLTISSTAVTTAPVKAQSSPSTFTVGWGAAPMDTLNPTAVTLYDGGAYVVMHAIYDTLVRADVNGNPIPDLAQSWSYTNSTTIVFNLAHNATWQDGQAFTADDVVYTVNTYLAHTELPIMRLYVQNVKSIQAIDQYTVQIQLKTPDATFIGELLPAMYIIPKHIWQNVANFTSYANSNPIGTGPFKVVSWGGVNTYVQFDANPNYFLGKPHIDHLVIRYFTSYNALALALQSGEIDYAGPLFPPALVPSLTSTTGIEVVTRPDQRYYYFSFNAYAQGAGNPTLRDLRVRIALSHAINNTELAQVVWAGYADPQNTVIPLTFKNWVNPNIHAYDFNLAEAAQMLDSAGYKVGSDGIRVSPTGVKLSYKIEVPSDYAEEYRAAQVIAGWWKQIGVQATPQVVDTGTLADEVVSWKHDTFIWVWSVGEIVGPDYFLSMFQSSEAQPAPNGGLSDSGFGNSAYDALYQQQLQATDPAERQAIIWQMQQILHDNAVYVPLYDPLAVQGFRSDRFTGLPGGTLPPLNQYAANNLFLSVTPISAPVETTQTAESMSTSMTTTPATTTGMSNETIAAIAAVIIIVIVAAVALSRRRKGGPAKAQ